MIDLHPAARRTASLLAPLTDEQLDMATPCLQVRLGDLVDHLGVFAVRFRAAARKDADGRTTPPPAPSRANLGPDWRQRIPRDLLALADAWQDPHAWEGSTVAGGIETPAAVVGLIALDELIVHGWDIAVATGQPYEPPVEEIEAAMTFVASFEAPRTGGLFGPIVAVDADAAPLHRLLGLTGRDPAWTPPA
ncbi:MAG: TIGR03086 family metal-binding protein [Ilumatobacteraceae bacterium]